MQSLVEISRSRLRYRASNPAPTFSFRVPGFELGQQVRRGSRVAQLPRLRHQRHDRQEPQVDRNAQKIDQIPGELGGLEALLEKKCIIPE